MWAAEDSRALLCVTATGQLIVPTDRVPCGHGGACGRIFPKTSERAKEPAPAHKTRMNQGVGVGKNPFPNLAGFPGIARSLNRHINHHRGSDDIPPRHVPPEAAVLGIAAIVAHDEIRVRGNVIGIAALVAVHRILKIRLLEGLSPPPPPPPPKLPPVAPANPPTPPA